MTLKINKDSEFSMAILDLQRPYGDDAAEIEEMMRESPLPMKRSKPARPPRRGSMSGTRPENVNGDGEMNGYAEDGKDDKKKRGKSPFR